MRGTIDSGSVGSTDFHSSHPQGRGAATADDAQETPTQSHISSNILLYEDYPTADPLTLVVQTCKLWGGTEHLGSVANLTSSS